MENTNPMIAAILNELRASQECDAAVWAILAASGASRHPHFDEWVNVPAGVGEQVRAAVAAVCARRGVSPAAIGRAQ